MIGIILGDGHVHKRTEKSYLDSAVVISLNRIDEPQYVDYVKNIMFKIFKKQPRAFARKDSKSVDLRISGDNIINSLVLKGIKTGDKVKNQVEVPIWIKKDKDWIESNKKNWKLNIRPLVIACLRGLVDTDGSVYVDHFNRIICIGFKNASLPLIHDFINMCMYLKFRTGKITETIYISPIDGISHTVYQVLIRAKSHVKEFLDIIKPMKWIFKMNEIEKDLNDLGTTIKEALTSKYKRRDEY
jgi:hypothetical protein